MRLDVAPTHEDQLQQIVSPEALDFVAELHARFDARRRELLAARLEREPPSSFLPETREIRDGDWRVAEPPDDWGGRAAIRWVERVAAGERFDPSAERFVEVAEIVDRICGRSA